MAYPIEIILSRQFADSLHFAAFLVDPLGNLLFYNEGAEALLGKRFSETGAMPVEEWSTIFKPSDDEGNLIPAEELPLVQSLSKQQAARRDVYIDSLRGERFHITISSFPIVGKAGTLLGAMALFWNIKE